MNRFRLNYRALIVIAGSLIGTVSVIHATTRMNPEPPVCPDGMVEVPTASTFTCVDQYEVSPSAACPYQSVLNRAYNHANLEQPDCVPVSRAAAEPWRFVSREEARLLCAKAGKRLPDAREWYEYSITAAVAKCNVAGGSVTPSGQYAECVTTDGVYDTVGNVWEWVGDDILLGEYEGRPLPPSGYITSVDKGGVAASTTQAAPETFLGYLWSEPGPVSGMLRGGFYGIKDDAAVFTLQANLDPAFAGAAIGFRCVQ